MNLGIDGKLALVTASSGGMGRNIARTLAAEGANVLLFARTAEKLQAVAEEIEGDYGVKAHVVAGSMLVADDVARLSGTLASLGGADIMVLVTGRPPNPLRDTLKETEPERWQEAYENQLLSVVQVVNAVAPQMLDKGWGRILAITSASAKQPMAVHALSTVFRAGVTAYLKGLANELGPKGITVNCVAPALIDTSHRSGSAAYTPAQAERRVSMTPLHRMGTQEELAGVVAFLASAQAGFVTGSTIAVEGGMIGSLF
ncbi:SDR family oxidoreductase [Ideonella azotifigens]|uniref:SDR family oxidoreductase n=1 Tax=Ideonella azotifigens TaxID=513160 RepID=A0ABP3V6E1_9BURK|nr:MULTISPECIES: SDR family oxidoreductase [Ideonella]MCD2341505.1 SDR family oxidoreductase [Ideonella azotifigens]HSI47094.1 SDR family oxidoreductase [Ideonella sp.]